MASITIDGKEIDTDELSQKAKENLVSLQFAQSELKKLQAEIAVYQTAAAAYSTALKNEIN
tara:strand:+ start:846 stop:1028 length:183 start_codon:yes stop_codon:yes gene_type:complete